jgi:hypothetical protein
VHPPLDEPLVRFVDPEPEMAPVVGHPVDRHETSG